jgi:methionine sulfoxide reductase heme-binding subunit
MRWLVPAAVALGLLPAGKGVLDGALGRLGADPIAEVQNRLGFWTLTLLTLSLAPTPAHDLLGLRWPVRVRRALGLLAFGYGALHFCWYLAIDRFFDLGEIARDLGKRRFITVGFAALLLLAPMALTSTDRWVRRLGFTRWKRLHRLAYAAAALGAVHFLWRVKADHRRPALFAAAIGILLALRLVRPARGWLARR